MNKSYDIFGHWNDLNSYQFGKKIDCISALKVVYYYQQFRLMQERVIWKTVAFPVSIGI